MWKTVSRLTVSRIPGKVFHDIPENKTKKYEVLKKSDHQNKINLKFRARPEVRFRGKFSAISVLLIFLNYLLKR